MPSLSYCLIKHVVSFVVLLSFSDTTKNEGKHDVKFCIIAPKVNFV